MAKSYDAAFRCTAYDSVPREGGDRLPGKELAFALGRELAQSGVAVSEVVVQEPFWIVRANVGGESADILVYSYLPHEDRVNATWAVSMASRERQFLGLFKQPEPRERIALIEALHAALKRLPQVRDLRWFRGLPRDPFGAASYSARPIH